MHHRDVAASAAIQQKEVDACFAIVVQTTIYRNKIYVLIISVTIK